jgi:Uma2 family endonuclease
MTIAEPTLKLWNRADYYRMAEAGLLAHHRVELIEGQVMEMAPVGSVHATMVTVVADVLQRVAGQGYFVRVQQPFVVSDLSEPEPDIALIAGHPRDYLDNHPTTAILLVEVADTSLTYDREVKALLYANAHVPEYWIINLHRAQVERYRNPEPDPLEPGKYRYTSHQVVTAQDEVDVLGTVIAVKELLP